MSLPRWTFVIAALSLAGPIHALEWEVDPITSMQFGKLPSPPTLFQEELLGSLKVPFDQKGGGFETKAHVVAATPSSFYADFDLLSFALDFQEPGSPFQLVQGTAGRFVVSEPTGLILNHSGDGLKFELKYGGFSWNVLEAYTGFVNRSSSGISMTLYDQSQSTQWFASPRIIVSTEAGLDLPYSQHATLGFLAQRDLNPLSKLVAQGSNVYSPSNGGLLDTQYSTLKFSGPIVEQVFYDGFFTLGTGSTLSWVTDSGSSTGYSYKYLPIDSFLLGGSVSYFRPDWKSAAFKFRFVAASGDTAATSTVEGNVNPASTLFLPMTSTTLGAAFSPALSNLIYYELGASAKLVPGYDIVTGAKLMGFQRAVAGVVNSPGVLSAGPTWLGEEIDLTATWPVTSDSLVRLTLGGFIPSSGTYISGSSGDGFQSIASLNAVLSL